jgi:hypothetical protein
VRRMSAHNRSSFGSNTRPCRAWSIKCSRRSRKRRTLTYFHSGYELIVRAPTPGALPPLRTATLDPLRVGTSWRDLLMLISKG